MCKRPVPIVSCLASLLAVLALMIGCADDPHKAPTSHPGDALLKDPFGYKPFQDDPSVSGGGIGQYDKKGMDRDVKNFWNP